MHLGLPVFNVLLIAFTQLSHSLPTAERRDAAFEDLRGLTKLARDQSGKEGDPEGKYFHESEFHPHYDGRFANGTQSNPSRIHHLTHLVRTYLSTMSAIGAETWIMHGSLLGWYWNRKIMPWDSDIDVQISERSIRFLADYYNMTIHEFEVPVYVEEVADGNGKVEGELEGRRYMLEINPHYTNDSIADVDNVIDARWIDMDTGLFIDITTLRRNRTAEKEGLMGMMMCKDRHHYLASDVFPLRDSVFEGMPVKVPYAYMALLEEEYGQDCLTRAEYEGHRFVQEKLEWVRIADLQKPVDSTNVGDYPHRAKRPNRTFEQFKGRPDLAKEVHEVPGRSLAFHP